MYGADAAPERTPVEEPPVGGFRQPKIAQSKSNVASTAAESGTSERQILLIEAAWYAADAAPAFRGSCHRMRNPATDGPSKLDDGSQAEHGRILQVRPAHGP